MNLVTIILLSILLQQYHCQIFLRGRKRGGNLFNPNENTKALKSVETQWITQKLDHFIPSDSRVWKQRYYTNKQYYNASGQGPIFLLIGGEGEASTYWMTGGSWIDYAQRFGALCFQLEHRYYGESRPTKNMNTLNLRYLTSQQALADSAVFINKMNEEHDLPSNAKWIVFGGSYAGSLAVWLRLKYPHLVHGVVSASGPLLAEVDFQDYFRVVAESLSTHSEECVVNVQKGMSEIDSHLANVPGQKIITKKFELCDPIEKLSTTSEDISSFYSSLAGHFAYIVQYNTKMKDITIDTLCNILTNETIGSSLDRLASINHLLLESYNEKCLNYNYRSFIAQLSQTNWNSAIAEGGRQWMYQTCTEFAFFQSSSHIPHVFSNHFPVEFSIQQCVDIFGRKYNSGFINNAVHQTNIIYGALDIHVTNVVFVHGSIDPWYPLGITKTVEEGMTAIYIKGESHCTSMYSISADDSPQLAAAKEDVANLINSWIQQ